MRLLCSDYLFKVPLDASWPCRVPAAALRNILADSMCVLYAALAHRRFRRGQVVPAAALRGALQHLSRHAYSTSMCRPAVATIDVQSAHVRGAYRTTLTQRATSAPLAWTSCVSPSSSVSRARARSRRSAQLTFDCLQKIRTVELEGKIIKLQIVRACDAWSARCFASCQYKPLLTAARACSGTRRAKSGSGPSRAATTAVLTASLCAASHP